MGVADAVRAFRISTSSDRRKTVNTGNIFLILYSSIETLKASLLPTNPVISDGKIC